MSEVRVVPRANMPRCPYCLDGLDAEGHGAVVECGGCRSVLHVKCSAELGHRCPTLGCALSLKPIRIEPTCVRCGCSTETEPDCDEHGKPLCSSCSAQLRAQELRAERKKRREALRLLRGDGDYLSLTRHEARQQERVEREERERRAAFTAIMIFAFLLSIYLVALVVEANKR